MAKFKAIVVEKADKGQTVSLTEFDEAGLMEGDVTVQVGWSTINYKDGLAITGKAPVVRRFPMIPGIDFAGEVEASSHPDWKPGDQVILNGWGTGETHLGAYAEKARVNGQWLVRLPQNLTPREAMARPRIICATSWAPVVSPASSSALMWASEMTMNARTGMG